MNFEFFRVLSVSVLKAHILQELKNLQTHKLKNLQMHLIESINNVKIMNRMADIFGHSINLFTLSLSLRHSITYYIYSRSREWGGKASFASVQGKPFRRFICLS